MNEALKLSIGMIVKNETKYLRKCLTALTPLLEQVKSELIIVDTGSTDDTVAIAKEFTEQVYFFEWCDDFAAARNETLKRATGEWYMFLDADEIFENITPIIEFFNSGEYKSYNSASHRLYSLMDKAEDQAISLSELVRLVKRRENTRFTGVIHEGIMRSTPTKALSALSMHHGYAFGDDLEKKASKHLRNIEPLLKEHREQPENLRTLAHIVKQYAFMDDMPQTIKYIDIMYELAKKNPANGYAIFAFYRKAVVANNARDFYAVIKVVNEYFNLKKGNIATNIDMYKLRGTAYLELKQWQEAIDDLQKSLDAFAKHNKGELDSSDLLYNELIIIKTNFHDENCCAIAGAYEELLDCDNAIAWLERIECFNAKACAQYIGVAQKRKKEELPLQLYRRLAGLEDKAQREAFIEGFESLVISGKLSQEAFAVFFRAEGDDPYVKLQALRYAGLVGNEIQIKRGIAWFGGEFTEWDTTYVDVLYLALKYHMDIAPLLETIDIGWFPKFLDIMKQYHAREYLELLAEQAGLPVPEGALKASYWNISLLEHLLLSDYAFPVGATVFERYARAAGSFAEAVYKPKMFAPNRLSALPGIYRFGYYMTEAFSAREQGDKPQYIANMKNALKSYPDMKKHIELLLEQFKGEQSALSEFDAYAVIVKKRVKALLAEGQLAAAKEILSELEQLLPGDAEVRQYLKECESQ